MSMTGNPAFAEALATRAPTVSQAYYEPGLKSVVVTFMMPVIVGDGGVVAVLGSSLQLRSAGLLSFLYGNALSDSSRELVLDARGIILAHPDQSRIMGLAENEPGLGKIYRTRMAGAHLEETTGQAVWSDGYLISFAAVAIPQWLLVRLTPEAQALEPTLVGRATAWKAGIGVGIAVALFAGLLAWLMTRPITQLRERAERLIANPDDANEMWPQAGGEVGALSRVLQHVVKQVQIRQLETQDMLRRLEAVLEHADIGVAFTRSSRFELVSRDVCRILACEEAQILGQPTRIMYQSEEAYQALAERARPAFMAHGAFDGELELVRLTGECFWAHLRGRAIIPGNQTAGTIWIIEDVTQARVQRERLRWTARHDSLTGLTNRLAFEGLLTEALSQVDKRPFCALFIDLDRFKHVNDTAGHAAGDSLLKEIAHRLETTVRATDTVARMGGDEFAVLLQQCPVGKAMEIAEKMRMNVDHYKLAWQGQDYSVGASIGLVHVDSSFARITEILEAADAACYAAKRQGRNRVVQHASRHVVIDHDSPSIDGAASAEP
jgi:diguanylate cyclase (GGDEF)-like protein/PAS domain S-box-containing protein